MHFVSTFFMGSPGTVSHAVNLVSQILMSHATMHAADPTLDLETQKSFSGSYKHTTTNTYKNHKQIEFYIPSKSLT